MYRRNVAAIVLNSENKILCCRRRDGRGWQLPQGGIEPGETPKQALVRELWEEVGLQGVTITRRLEEALRYDWPPEARRAGDSQIGQEQYYFLVTAPEENLAAIAPTEDFDLYEWVSADEAITRVVEFKREVYREAFRKLGV